MRACWSKQDDAATAQLNHIYAALTATLKRSGESAANLVMATNLATAQRAWNDARDKTCAFEYALYEGGTIAPLLGVECDTRLIRARTQRLAALESAFETAGKAPPAQPLNAKTAAQLNRLYALYQPRLTAQQRTALASSDGAWTLYRQLTCSVEGGSCLTDLTKERISELETAWLGEAFW
jgi:uncharacterized protein YecT (DUF1311 family)